MILIPAIDIRSGKTVRLTEGDYSRQTSYEILPEEAAQGFEQDGAEWIHIVDLDGAKAGSPVNLETFERVRAAVACRIEAGGGVRSLEAARALLDLGIDRVVAGTRVVTDPELARRLFGELGPRAVAGIDMKDGMAATHGWQEVSELSGMELALQLQEMGCERAVVTDIATDGQLAGPNLPLMKEFASSLSMKIVASGGVAALGDLEALSQTGVEAVIVGKAFYEGRFTVAQALGVLSQAAGVWH